jgi:hypothetical protein
MSGIKGLKEAGGWITGVIWPMAICPYCERTTLAATMRISDTDRELILGGNAKRLVGI